MTDFDRKKHWDDIYQKRCVDEVSWYQQSPATSLQFVEQFNLPRTAKIIDVGGGESFFVDYLLDLGYLDITVLDISKNAIDSAKLRLGEKGEKVKWIVSDITDFVTSEKYDLWHDRAAFHFLTDNDEIEKYIEHAKSSIKLTGYLVIGTFSEQGPEKCSGIYIKQYSQQSMTDRLKNFFKTINCISVNHKTPFDTIQNFIFCSFKRISNV
jgi:2-polyprenyl-3-methyl-5-hydroxy-6-metoxy-1,4-benzoquinol methylase